MDVRNNNSQTYQNRGVLGGNRVENQQQVDNHDQWMQFDESDGFPDGASPLASSGFNDDRDQRSQIRIPQNAQVSSTGSQVSRAQREGQDSILSSFYPPPSPAELYSTLSNSGTYASAHPLAQGPPGSSQEFVASGVGASGDADLFFADDNSALMSRSYSHGVGMNNQNHATSSQMSSRGTGIGAGGVHMSASASGPGSFGNSSQPYPDWSSLSMSKFGTHSSSGPMMGTISENPQSQVSKDSNLQRRSLDSNLRNYAQFTRSQQANHSASTEPNNHKRGSGSYGPAFQSTSGSTIASRRHNSLNAAAAVTPPRIKSSFNGSSKESLPFAGTSASSLMESPEGSGSSFHASGNQIMEDRRDDRYKRSGSGSGIGPGSADPADADASGDATASGTNSRSESIGEEKGEGMDAVDGLAGVGNSNATHSSQPFGISGIDVDIPSSMIRAPEPSLSMGGSQNLERRSEAPDGLHVASTDRPSQTLMGANQSQSQSQHQSYSSSTPSMLPLGSPTRRQFLAQVPSSQASSSEDLSSASRPANLASSARMIASASDAASGSGANRHASGVQGRRKTLQSHGSFVASDSTAGSHPSDNEAVTPFTSTPAFLGAGKSNSTNTATSFSTTGPESASRSNSNIFDPTNNAATSIATHKIANAPYQTTASDFTRRKGWPVRVVEEIVDFVHVIDVREDSPALGEGSNWQNKVQNGITLTRRRREYEQKEKSRSAVDGQAAYSNSSVVDPSRQNQGLDQNEMISHTIDSPLAFHFVGPRITPLTGWSPDELRGKGIWEFIHPDDIQAVISNFSKVRSSPSEDLTVFYRFRRKPSTVRLEVDSDARSTEETTTSATSGDGDTGVRDPEVSRRIVRPQTDLSSMATSFSSADQDGIPPRRPNGKSAARVRNDNDPEKEYVLFEATGHAFFGGAQPSLSSSNSDSQDHPLRSKDVQAILASAVSPHYESSSFMPAEGAGATGAASRSRSNIVTSATPVLALFCSARVYPPETVSMLDSFLELKVENQKLKSLIDKVQNDLSIADEEENSKVSEQHKTQEASKNSSSGRKSKFQKMTNPNAPSADDMVSNLDKSMDQSHQQQLTHASQYARGPSTSEATGFATTTVTSPVSNFNSASAETVFPASSEASFPSQGQLLDAGGNDPHWYKGNNISSFSPLDPNLPHAASRPGHLGMRAQTHAFYPASHSTDPSMLPPTQESHGQQRQLQSQLSQFQHPHSPPKHGSHPYSRPVQTSRAMSLGGEANLESSPVKGFGNQSVSSQPHVIQQFLANSKSQQPLGHSAAESQPGSPDAMNSATINFNRQQQQAMINHARRISASSFPNVFENQGTIVPSNAPSSAIGEPDYSANVSQTTVVAVDDKDKKKKGRKAKNEGDYVCTDCGRNDSPEWRKGPHGPKTLCNACGLRYAKQVKKETGEEDGSTAAAKEEKKKLREARKEAKHQLKKDEKKEAKKSGNVSRKTSRSSIKVTDQTGPSDDAVAFQDQQQQVHQQQQQRQQNQDHDQNQNNQPTPHFDPSSQFNYLPPDQQHQSLQQPVRFSGADHQLSSMDMFGGLGVDIGMPNMNMMDMDLQGMQMPPKEMHQQQQQYRHQFSNAFGNQHGSGSGNDRPVWE